MGACSSKPKTTEFEGSIEPRKPADVAADQPHETGRGPENLADELGKDAPIKAGGGEAAHASTEAVQTKTTPELEADKDEGPSKEMLSRSLEGSSEAQSDVLGKKETVLKEVSDEVKQKEYMGDGVSDAIVQKDDEGVLKDDLGGGIVDSESANICADKKEVNVVDEAKTCEDKAVVSEDSRTSQGDAAYVDKTVAVDKEKAPETPEKRNIIVPENEGSAMLDSAESAGIESPIIGVVLPVEPRNKVMNEEDVSKNVEADKVGEHDDSQQDSKVAEESCPTGAGEADVHVIATKDGQEDVVTPLREDPSGGIEDSGVEMLAPTIVVETFPPAGACETLAPAEADSLKDGEEGTSQPHGETPDDAAVVSSATMDSKSDTEERSTVIKAGVPLDESLVNLNEDSHGTTSGDRVSADSLELETLKATEDTASEVSTTESKAKDAQEESVNEKSERLTAEVMDATQALATEVVGEDVRPTVALSESILEREEKVEQAAEETSDKPHVEHTSGGDVTFEDASDAPLTLEASKSIEPGQVPS